MTVSSGSHRAELTFFVRGPIEPREFLLEIGSSGQHVVCFASVIREVAIDRTDWYPLLEDVDLPSSADWRRAQRALLRKRLRSWSVLTRTCRLTAGVSRACRLRRTIIEDLANHLLLAIDSKSTSDSCIWFCARQRATQARTHRVSIFAQALIVSGYRSDLRG